MNEHLLRFNKDKIYTFIDCETENLCLNGFHNLPWQIAMIKVRGEEILDTKDYYVKWDRELHVSKEAARITRFSAKTHKERALSYKEVFPTIKDWLETSDYIVGHNLLGFDIYLIRDLYKKMDEDYKPLLEKIIDTLAVARGLKSGEVYKPDKNFLEYQYKMINYIRKGMRASLSALGKENEIPHDYDNLHDALVDLGLNLKVWNHLKWKIEI
jgi:DNA polymerase III epsilon subunit-like protein